MSDDIRDSFTVAGRKIRRGPSRLAAIEPDTPPSIRGRCEAAAKPYLRTESDTNIWAAVDAILSELQEPSEGMKASGGEALNQSFGSRGSAATAAWRAMIQHIRDGGS